MPKCYHQHLFRSINHDHYFKDVGKLTWVGDALRLREQLAIEIPPLFHNPGTSYLCFRNLMSALGGNMDAVPLGDIGYVFPAGMAKIDERKF
jgi:hypothetical protein